jgi:glycosyltransferase involved in cell wall biosynthesis
LIFSLVITKFYSMDPAKLSTLQLISVRWWNANAYYAISLCQILQQKNIKVLVGGQPGSPPVQMAIQKHLNICHINLESFNPWHWLKNIKKLENAILENRINLINAHRPEDHFYSGILKRRLAGIPLIRSVSDVRPPKRNYLNKILHLKHTDHFIFSCQASRDRYLQVWPLPLEKTSVIYSGIDTRYFSEQSNHTKHSSKFNIPSDTIIFGMVGRFSPVKDHITFLKAAAILASKIPHTFFIISGEEVEIKTAQLQQLGKRLGIANKILFLEKVTDVREVIRLITVGVICSYGSEAVSRITAEFMAMSRPVIVTRINVLPEMITDGKEGFIVPAQSPEQLSQKMQVLVQNPRLLGQMKEDARKTAEQRFSYQRFYQDTIAAYEKVLNRISQGTP